MNPGGPPFFKKKNAFFLGRGGWLIPRGLLILTWHYKFLFIQLYHSSEVMLVLGNQQHRQKSLRSMFAGRGGWGQMLSDVQIYRIYRLNIVEPKLRWDIVEPKHRCCRECHGVFKEAFHFGCGVGRRGVSSDKPRLVKGPRIKKLWRGQRTLHIPCRCSESCI